MARDDEAIIRRISLRRLMDGGAAILAQIRRNHHREIIGTDISKPFVRAILRVRVNSYVIFAIQKRPEDTRP